MDDVASELGISKKTLYRFVTDKTDLVEKVVLYHKSCQQERFCEIASKKQTAIDTLLQISTHVSQFLKDISPAIRHDLQKYYPHVLKMHMEYQRGHVIENVKANLQKGIKEGLYRKDLHIDIVTKIYVSRLEIMFDQDLFPFNEYLTAQVFDEMFKYHIHGIASKKGIEYFEKKIKGDGRGL